MAEPTMRDWAASGGDLPANAHEMVNRAVEPGLDGKLGIVFEEVSAERVVATMPVVGNTQPYGFLHGGATMALAEGMASTGAAVIVAHEGKIVMGLQQTCNFLSTATEGSVRAVATPLHVGRTTQIWDVDVRSVETGKRVATARVTIAVREPRD